MVKIQPKPSRPWVIAHRGARGGHPLHSPGGPLLENSAAAMARAQQLGVDGIETDLRLSQDGAVMLCHDSHLQRLAGVDRWVADCTAAELEGMGLLRLEHALRDYRQQRLFLELKDDATESLSRRKALVESTLAAVQASEGGASRLGHPANPANPAASGHPTASGHPNTGAELLLLSFSDPLLRWAADLNCGLRCGRNMLQPELHPYDYLSCRIDGLNAEFVAAAHFAGQPVITWTVSTDAELNHALHCGVDGIISDHPAWLQHELASR
jgi:glycerophosphoryl diester phosphodiesterase